jgi:hypothetical protein
LETALAHNKAELFETLGYEIIENISSHMTEQQLNR